MPIVRTGEEAEAHDPERSALVELPGRWVRGVVWLRDHIQDAGAAGKMSRGAEALLVGLADDESVLIVMGLQQCVMASSDLTRPPEEVLTEVVTMEGAMVVTGPGVRIAPALTVAGPGVRMAPVMDITGPRPGHTGTNVLYLKPVTPNNR